MVAMEGSGVEGARWYDQQASHQVHVASRLNPHQEELQVPSPYFPGAYHGYSSAMNHGMHHCQIEKKVRDKYLLFFRPAGGSFLHVLLLLLLPPQLYVEFRL